MKKVNPSLALTCPFPLVFLSHLFIAFKAIFYTNLGSKGIVTFVSDFFTYSRTKTSTSLNYFRYMSFAKFYFC